MKITQGKWSIESGPNIYAIVCKEYQAGHICEMSLPYPYKDEHNNTGIGRPIIETDANAKLISAAPELFKACELAYEVLSGNSMTKDNLIKALEACQSATKKAKGE